MRVFLALGVASVLLLSVSTPPSLEIVEVVASPLAETAFAIGSADGERLELFADKDITGAVVKIVGAGFHSSRGSFYFWFGEDGYPEYLQCGEYFAHITSFKTAEATESSADGLLAAKTAAVDMSVTDPSGHVRQLRDISLDLTRLGDVPMLASVGTLGKRTGGEISGQASGAMGYTMLADLIRISSVTGQVMGCAMEVAWIPVFGAAAVGPAAAACGSVLLTALETVTGDDLSLPGYFLSAYTCSLGDVASCGQLVGGLLTDLMLATLGADCTQPQWLSCLGLGSSNNSGCQPERLHLPSVEDDAEAEVEGIYSFTRDSGFIPRTLPGGVGEGEGEDSAQCFVEIHATDSNDGLLRLYTLAGTDNHGEPIWVLAEQDSTLFGCSPAVPECDREPDCTDGPVLRPGAMVKFEANAPIMHIYVKIYCWPGHCMIASETSCTIADWRWNKGPREYTFTIPSFAACD